ncbi:NAD(P)-dependent oxidoreductase, partial [uncultured Muriicola sp.]|uniref:SDR family oxidoreductase n=1 Tax=uncultured Muriicola sp. TaxID=1583102 RepID=UPI002629FF09
MMNVLVTGAEGQLGKCIRELASSNSQIKFDFTDKSQLDIVKRADVINFFLGKSYDYCVNCAAYTNVDQAERTPEIAFAVNAEGVKNLALTCLENGVKLIHISTDYVFDGEKKEGYYPKDIPNPINEYGKSKLKGELYIQQILNEYIIIRTSWLYSDYGHNFYKSILEKAHKGEILYVTDSQVGCPTDANHLAYYILDCLQRKHWISGIVHFTDK